MSNETDHKKMDPVWFWWAIFTVIYIAFNLKGFPVNYLNLGDYPNGLPLMSYIAAFFGLFAPYGTLSFISLVTNPLSWVSFVIFFLFMKYISTYIKKHRFSKYQIFFICLLSLLLITIVVDIIRGTPFASWNILFTGHLPQLPSYSW
ncbi:MAG: hypothetical protein Q7S01_02915 [bacterium]|nr:hypothetical protein [bacterium]